MSIKLQYVLMVATCYLASPTFAQTKRRSSNSKQQQQQQDIHEDTRGSSVIDDDDSGIIHIDTGLPREEKIMHYEQQLADVKDHDVAPALDRYYKMSKRHKALESDAGWFPSASDKHRLEASEKEVAVTRTSLEDAQNRERAVIKRLKPLYGLISAEFFADQQVAIGSSLKQINDMAYNNAWYSSMFDMFSRRGDKSLQDIIIGFFVQWLMTYMIMYPFGVLYYALWVLPWSIFDYSSSSTDIAIGVILYVGWIIVMLLPIVALLGAIWGLIKFYGPQMKRHFEEQEARRAARRGQGGGGDPRYQQRIHYQ